MPRTNPWIPAELVAIETRTPMGVYARFKTDHGGEIAIDHKGYGVDGAVMQAIARAAGVQDVEEGTGAFVRIRLDEDGLVRAVADMDGGSLVEIQPIAAGA